MGGGDLNLKKSWHPSTLRNIERVWKAEQKHEAEQQKIEQLQKELAAERAREEMQTYAEDKGVVRKRDERLDWMYQGPASLVSREDYLMGRKIDKTFDLMEMQENGQTESKTDTDGPASLFRPGSSTSDVTVDLATKIREDPLFAIMKREKEQRKNLLNNPVKMKQLKKMLERSITNDKKTKSKKGKKSHSKRSSSSSSSSSSEEEEPASKKSKKSARHEEVRDSKSHRKSYDHKNRHPSRERQESDTRYSSNHRDIRASKQDNRSYSSSKDRNSMKYDDSRHTRDRAGGRHHDRESIKFAQRPEQQKKLSTAEKERMRQEMMDNAKWREDQRKNNVQRYIKEAELEDHIGDRTAEDFIRPMLSKAAESGSVEGRVKQKIFTIQRRRGDMDKHFARR